MNLTRTAVLLGGLVCLLFCLGLGWGPASAPLAPVRVALIGLAAAGLLWPALVLRVAIRRREAERSARSQREAI